MNTKPRTSSTGSPPDLKSQKNLTTVVYALQAAVFFVGFTYFLAPVINYVKRDTVQGTWLESHFRWQITTFWYSLAWAILGVATLLWEIGAFVLLADAMWIVYRISQGWMALSRNEPMPLKGQLGLGLKPRNKDPG